MDVTTAPTKSLITNHLSPTAVKRYRELGYHYPVRVMSTEQATAYMQKLEAHEAAYGLDTLRHKPHLYLTWLDELVRLPTILDIVSNILGPNIMVHSSSFFIKEPRSPAYVSWHQDSHYGGLDSDALLTAWVALLDSDTENGALRVVPASHLVRLPHVDTFAKDNMLSRGQEIAVDIGDQKYVELTLKAGEMSLHHVSIVHGSEPNNSDRRRVGFAIRYMAPHLNQTISTSDSAGLVRGIDPYNNFEHEPQPKADMAPEALAYHTYTMERYSKNLMKSNDNTINKQS